MYGPRQIPHGEAGVVSIFIEKILAGAVPVIFGGGVLAAEEVHALGMVGTGPS